ncbi:hypothetical protein SAMN05216359_101526 [Roseateles sp. YR242]|uniref:hypothetical protein n=1 Tax=Roseateles sp. YR242 TaxID=1855305 RepID=UPI0008D60A77|nr:hypothetical protein [Roseateles sp. YR242]SEK35254.1 hypothetical protein SAMN05216359_101526 [Roseateles sp. YR242]
MSTTPPKRRAPARNPRAAMAPAEVIADIVGDVSLDLVPKPSLMPASIDDAVEDIFQALMADEDDHEAGAAGAPVVPEPAEAAPEAVAKPARKRPSRARVAEPDEAAAEPRKRAPARKRAKPAGADTEAAAEGVAQASAEGVAKDATMAALQADDAAASVLPAAGPSAGLTAPSPVERTLAQRAESDGGPTAEPDAPLPVADPESEPPAKGRRKPRRAVVEQTPEEPQGPPRFTLGAREDDGVFGDYELRDGETGGTFHLRLLGRALWRCDCAQYAEQGDCEHGGQLLSLFDQAQHDALEAGWPAREAEVWLVPGPERRLQWIAGREVPAALRDQPELDERQRRDAEQSQSWLQSLVSQARAAGVALRVDAPVWPQLAWGRDALARVQRLEAFMSDGDAMRGLLTDALPPHQWEAALFAVCAGRALVADDLGLGQRGAAIAAIRLWERLFGAAPALVIAPEAQHAAWRRDLTRWLGDAASGVVLAEQPTAKHAPALLVVDGIDAIDEEALAALRALALRTGAQLLLIAAQEPLSHPLLPTWVDWLDTARRGPWARFWALPADAGKKALREALAQVVLSRRKRELVERLPACLTTPLWLEAAGSSLPQGPLKQLRQTLERWQARPFLNSAEQQQLMEALGLLPPASRQALAAKAEAVLALRRDWVESPTPAASRLLVCSRSETLLDSLSQSPQLRRLPPHRLRAGDSDEAVAQTLQAWRAAPAGVLLASDDALAAMPEGLLEDERMGVVHADLPWQAETVDERVALACGDDACGVPAALLLITGSLDTSLSKAHAKGLSFPDWLDAPPAWLDQAQIEALMAVLPALLEGL